MKDRLNLSATDLFRLHRPSLCERRVFLLAHEKLQGEPSEFEQIIREMGERHEQEQLADYPTVWDLRDGNNADRAKRTRDAVSKGDPVIYYGVLHAPFPESKDVVTGIPDFLIRDGDSYRICDCKLSRIIRYGKHPEIALQLQTYEWLFERTLGHPPSALEAFLGDRTIDSVAYQGADYAVRELGLIRGLAMLAEEPWEPVEWTKCGACPFQKRCWTRAEKSHDIAVIYKVDKGTASAFRDKGITT